jgi:hypothetical protein
MKGPAPLDDWVVFEQFGTVIVDLGVNRVGCICCALVEVAARFNHLMNDSAVR